MATGVIIAMAGWLIFSPTFVGISAEFFAAFLWGWCRHVARIDGVVKGTQPKIKHGDLDRLHFLSLRQLRLAFRSCCA